MPSSVGKLPVDTEVLLPGARVGVEFHGEAPDVALGIGRVSHAGGLDVLVVGNGFPVFGGQSFLVHILSFFVGMQKMPDRFMIEFHIIVIQSKNIAIRIGVASLGICFFCEERTVGVNFSGKSTLFFGDLENFTIFVPLTGD